MFLFTAGDIDVLSESEKVSAADSEQLGVEIDGVVVEVDEWKQWHQLKDYLHYITKFHQSVALTYVLDQIISQNQHQHNLLFPFTCFLYFRQLFWPFRRLMLLDKFPHLTLKLATPFYMA